VTAAAHPAARERAAARAAAPDLAAIRAAFPALERVHGGHPVAYFDGPGGTQVPRPVVAAMADYLYHHNANTHWAYPTSAETDALLLAAREALADFVGGAPEEIAFGANMTSLTFHLARAIARGVRGRPLGPGDEIVATELDHHANVAPWREAARERGVALRVVRMDAARGCLDLDDLAAAIGPRTRVVAVGAASNALGTVTDVARVAEMARAVGALTFVDAVHYAPHNLVDVAALGCDFLACSAYKFYGPHVGALWGKGELIAALDVPKLDPAPDVGAERLETGTQNHEGIVGAGAAVDFLASIGGEDGARGGTRRERLGRAFAGLHEVGRALLARLHEGLASIDGVTLYGLPPDAPRTPTLSFTVRGQTSEEVARRLAADGVFVSHGDFYAATVVERLGVEGLVRAGCACYTSADEVDRLVAGVRTLAR
jgi:cysteine desulfurase family protein (TIGR01976 family)